VALIERPIEGRLFLEGPAGSGKTTVGVGRLLYLLRSGVPARSILIIVPQRTLATPYHDALRRPTVDAGGQVAVFTIGGLAQRMVDLFWPVIAEEAGFAQPDQPPTFLTLETAQYYMTRLVRPLLDRGYFEPVVIDRNRLYSQIIDNLNKAAVVGFPYSEIGERLGSAWTGEESQRRIYDEAQACATRFREYCLAHNLLDFSLQVEVFVSYLWTLPLCRDYILETYTHLIVDNVEEDTPVAHDLVREWLGHCRSALVIADWDGGHRRFLGADPTGGLSLGEACEERIAFTDSCTTSPDVQAFGCELARSVNRPAAGTRDGGGTHGVLIYEWHRFQPEMLDWVAAKIAALVRDERVPPGEIVVLVPFLGDALRFALTHRLDRLDVPVRSHRPSRALRDEPAARCLLTCAAIAHPWWGICPSRLEVAHALVQAIEDMDLVRASLLADIVYRVRENQPSLGSFDRIVPEMKDRLTFVLGERFERLRGWISAYVDTAVENRSIAQPREKAEGNSAGALGCLREREPVPLDHFLKRLFGEVLSQSGYGFHRGYGGGEVAANLIESVQKFRRVAGPADVAGAEGKPLGQEYLEMVRDGVIAAQYIRGWRLPRDDAVLLAPAYTFLMSNRPADVQFWLNVGSSGWWERLYQPLTHPYVLSRSWSRGRVWTDADEVEVRREALRRLTLGLVRRCRRRIYLGLSEMDEQGKDQRGPLLQAIQTVLRGRRDEGRDHPMT
jgi:hypothetical protein